jgi:large subunit ribosomal protein L20
VLKQTKGQVGGARKLFRTAVTANERAMAYAYRDRKRRKREFRSLWITRINAACRQRGLSYSQFINGLKKADVEMDRRVMAEIAVADPAAFDELFATAKAALS